MWNLDLKYSCPFVNLVGGLLNCFPLIWVLNVVFQQLLLGAVIGCLSLLGKEGDWTQGLRLIGPWLRTHMLLSPASRGTGHRLWDRVVSAQWEAEWASSGPVTQRKSKEICGLNQVGFVLFLTVNRGCHFELFLSSGPPCLLLTEDGRCGNSSRETALVGQTAIALLVNLPLLLCPEPGEPFPLAGICCFPSPSLLWAHCPLLLSIVESSTLWPDS